MKNSTKSLVGFMTLFVMVSGLAGCNSSTSNLVASNEPSPSSSTTSDTGSENSAPTPSPTSPSPASSTAAATLDATDCNPGESINPIDKGKSFSSTNFKYTLLDVRKDDLEVDPYLKNSIKYNKVLLVKLQVENISQHDDLNLSIGEVDLTRNAAPTDARIKDDKYMTDVMYPQAKICVNLATDVDRGKFPVGKKVVGYYVYGLPDDKTFDQGLFFGARYYAAEDVETGKSLKVAGSFKIQ